MDKWDHQRCVVDSHGAAETIKRMQDTLVVIRNAAREAQVDGRWPMSKGQIVNACNHALHETL